MGTGGEWESRLHCVGGVRVVHREVLGTGGGGGGESSTLCGRCEGGTQVGIGHWGGVGESSSLCGRCEGGTQGGIGHWGGGESRLHCVGGVRVVHR